ncbi:hypothetical protein [Citrobacter koseri]|uniref:hypothetical protein n=1 Tax=Citrobacter koseri TaxID=545 RepID=UPI00388D48E2
MLLVVSKNNYLTVGLGEFAKNNCSGTKGEVILDTGRHGIYFLKIDFLLNLLRVEGRFSGFITCRSFAIAYSVNLRALSLIIKSQEFLIIIQL